MALLALPVWAWPVWGDELSPADGLPSICPDRPGKGTSPCTLDAGHVQLELGLGDGSFQHRAGVTTDLWVAAAPVLKYGVRDGLDIEAGMPLLVSQRVHDASGTRTLTGIGDLTLRGKAGLWQAGRLALALDPFLKIPTAAAGLGNGKVEGGLTLPLSYDLGAGWALGATPEADLLLNGAGSGYHVNAVAVMGIGRGLGDGVTLGAEVWTAQNFDPAGTVRQYSLDLDAAWSPDADLQLDGGVNAGLNRATPDLEIYAGISERF